MKGSKEYRSRKQWMLFGKLFSFNKNSYPANFKRYHSALPKLSLP